MTLKSIGLATTVLVLGALSKSPAQAQYGQTYHLRHMFMLGRPVAQLKSPDRTAYRKKPPAPYLYNARVIAERGGYKPVSSLVNFPQFFPGLGVIYVRPSTLPLGPFLCFDRKDNLMSTVYMIPIQDFEDHKKFDLTQMAKFGDHLTIYYNSGHPGVPMPHYHVVVWHVPKQLETLVSR